MAPEEPRTAPLPALAVAASLPAPASAPEPEFPAWLLNTGFMVALVLSSACLVAGGYYLYRFQGVTQDSVLKVLNGKTNEAGLYQIALGAQLYLARVQLVSCGIFIGMAFGFLGFSLFLLGIKGQMDAEGSYASARVRLASLAPGAFVLLCATILIGVCVTRPLHFGYDREQAQAPPPKTTVTVPVLPPSTILSDSTL